MFRILFAIFILTAGFNVIASSPLEQVMTVKQRLRLHLWSEGLVAKGNSKPLEKFKLPNEIEMPLRKL